MKVRCPSRSFHAAAFLIGAAALPLSTLAATAPKVEPTPPAAVEPVPAAAAATDIPAEAQFHIMAGELAAGREQPDVAAREFYAALEMVPDAQLATRATGLALRANNEELALASAQRWLELAPNSLEAREVIIRLALRRGQLAEVLAQCGEVIKGHPGGEADGFRSVALLLSQEPDLAEPAMAVMQQLVNQWPKEAAAHHALALAALRFGQMPLAEKAVRESLRLEPGSQESALLLAGVLVRNKDLAGADVVMDKLLKKSKQRDDMRLAYTKLLLESGAREHAREQLRKIQKDNPKNEDALYALGVLAMNDNSLDEAESLFKPLTKDPDRGKDAIFQLGRIAEKRGDNAAALKYYESVTGGGQALEAAVRRATVLAKLNRLDEARGLLGQLRRQFPPLSPRLYAAEAEILIDAGKPELAVATYTDGLRNDSSDVDMLYGRSLIHERLQQYDLAEADLRKVIEIDADDARALNALGYMLTTQSKKLDEARTLIQKALALSPDDAAVIDSMGWVEFKRGELNTARTWLQKAYDKVPDPEIAAHLGEVMWAMGEKDQARTIWQKALADDPEHSAVKETIQRLVP